MSVYSPWHHGHKAVQRWVGARDVDVCLCRSRQRSILCVISNDTSLISIIGYDSTTVGEYSTDPIVSVRLYRSGWVSFDNDRVSLA